MPRVTFDGFCGPSYLAASPVLDAQRSINLYPEPGYRTSKSGMALIGRPGLTLFAFGLFSPLRTLWAGNGRLFAVGGNHAYELSAIGGVTTDYGAIGGTSGLGPAQLIANGTQLLLCDPGTPGIYSLNPLGPSVVSVFSGVALEYLDGFYVAIATGASLAGANPNQLNVSANGDGTTWPALNFALRTSAADLTMQLATLNGLLWVFGQKTTTVFYNAGNPGFPFARVNGGDINLGLLAAQSVVKFYNCIMWLGADDKGYAQVYMAQGLNPVRVSNFAIEQYLATVNTFGTLGASSAYGYQENGHTFYVLNMNNAFGGPTVTLVYDLTTGLWHERHYTVGPGPYPSCGASLYNFSNAPNYVGDGYSGKVYNQSSTYPSDDGANITYTRTAPHANQKGEWVKYSRFELDGDFGTATPTLTYSNDGGRTFPLPTGAPRQLQQAQDQGAIGTYRRFFATQLGRSRDRVFQMQIVDNTNLIRIANAYLNVDGGGDT